MSAAFLNRHVSINCGPTLGFFQGRIKAVDSVNQTLCITHPYKNGILCDFPEITLASQDIVDLTLIDNLPDEVQSVKTKLPGNSVNESSNKISKSSRRSSAKSLTFAEKDTSTANTQSHSPPRLTHSFKEQRYSHVRDGRPQANVIQRPKATSFRNQDDCFNVDCNELEEFDFEKNLALFDKQAVYDEVYSGSDGEVRTPSKWRKEKPVAKYRHDENVIASQPTVYRQIVLTNSVKSEVTEYYTDTGLVIPCISPELHHKVCEAAIELGLGITRQIEIFGVNASQMALNLLGGGNRLHPRNAHQRPHVVVFAGPHLVGAQGIAAARHLATQNIQIEVFLPNFVKMNESLQEELKLLGLTDARLVEDVKDLTTSPVDLLVLAVDDDQSAVLKKQPWYDSVTLWCSRSIAPIMCLCPPAEKVARPAVNIRWSVCSVLPRSLSPSYGMIYLIDLGFPAKVFRRVGIKYRSPFCAKPYIALHTSR